jgi:uroporphyrinogen decarboxylase
MNPRERILTAYNHHVPDRTPTDGWFHRELQKDLMKYYRTENWDEVLQLLGIEGWVACSPYIRFPEYEKKATDRPGGKPWKKAIWLDERTYRDAWGVQHRLGEGDWYEEWITGPLVNASCIEDIEKCKLPEPKDIEEPENYAGQVENLKRNGHFVSGGIPNPYKTAWLLRGMHNVLADYLINRDFLEVLYDRLYNIFGTLCEHMARGGVDQITVTGDIAMQDRIIMGPEPWRQVDKPRLAKLIDRCREINPDIFFFIHSDGDVTELMDDIVEIGFNVVNPIQPECMDPVEVKKRYGKRIVMHGGISLQKALPNGTPGEAAAEVEYLIRECGYDGGLVVFPSNVIQPGTPVENVISCFHAARDFDVSSLGVNPG